MSIDGAKWPARGDSPFKPASNLTGTGTFLPIGDTSGEYWWKAGNAMVAAALAVEHPDRIAFVQPILFLYRHSIELDLKALLRIDLDSGATKHSPPDHNLQELWNRVRRKLVASNFADKDALSAVEMIVKDFVTVDPIGATFRYAQDKKGEVIAAPNQIDLQNLQEVMEGIRYFMEYAYLAVKGEA